MRKLLLLLMIVPMIGWGQCLEGNCENGKGTIVYPNGDKYVGDFKNNQPDGQGTAYYSMGNKYVGEWKNGERNGYGTFVSLTAGTWQGEFKDDMPVIGKCKQIKKPEK
jgi:hypothetical protein